MSIGPTGFFATVAALPPATPRGSDTERAAQETSAQAGQISNDAKAELAAGIGATDGEEHATAERDADGRRLFERIADGDVSDGAPTESEPALAPLVKDPTGESGGTLDLIG